MRHGDVRGNDRGALRGPDRHGARRDPDPARGGRRVIASSPSTRGRREEPCGVRSSECLLVTTPSASTRRHGSCRRRSALTFLGLPSRCDASSAVSEESETSVPRAAFSATQRHTAPNVALAPIVAHPSGRVGITTSRSTSTTGPSEDTTDRLRHDCGTTEAPNA